MTSQKTGILLLNMGGPDSLENVKPFLVNLFSDPDIIRLPFSNVLQKPLANRIATQREKEAQDNYAAMGGFSPILKYTQDQAEALKAELAKRGYGELNTYIAMRYWHPFTDAAVGEIMRDGIQRLIVLPLYPHFSYTTTGSSLNELKRVLEARGIPLELAVIPSYYERESYQRAVAENIQYALDHDCWTCPKEQVQLLFTAHSLPLKHIKRTKDPYPEQIHETAKSIAKTYFPNNPWEVSYQSQVGKMPWLGPSTDGVLHYFSGKKIDNILMIAISFVSDHVETLVEIDRLYIPMANELEIKHCHRAPALNTNDAFIQALADVTAEQLDNTTASVATFPTFPELLQAQASS
jgi:ferrochelatase